MRLRLFAAAGAVLVTSILTVALAASPAGAAPFTYTSVSTGYHRTCAVTTDGLGLCWGWNHSGSLGTSDRSSTVLTPSLVRLPAGERFRTIEAGSYFTSCGLTVSGTVYCWGEGGAPGRWPLPAGIVVEQLSVGASQVCALTDNRQLWCTGDWNSGEIGTGNDEYTHLPVRIVLPDAAVPSYVSAGIGFTCVVTTVGSAYCAGVNGDGQLGNGHTSPSRVYTRVVLPDGVSLASISAGLERTCALDTNGAGWCWGRNYNGAFGDGTYTNSRTPRRVALADGTGLVDIRTSWYHTCGIATSGRVLCWGEGSGGSLGWGGSYGGRTIREAALPDGVTATVLRVGLGGTCATTADARVFCWGSNLRGSAGVGSTSPVFTPAEILRVGSPDADVPSVTSTATHSAALSGTFVPNGATASVSLLVATTSTFDDARTIPVTLRRSQQSNFSQLFAPVAYSASVPGLRPATTYFVKSRATNTFGTTDSTAITFTTLGGAPVVVSTAASTVGGDNATVDAVVEAALLDTTVSMVYSTDPALLDDTTTASLGTATGSGRTALSATLESLAPRTTYFARVAASNEVATAQGDIFSFTTIGDAPVIVEATATGGRGSATVTVDVDPGLLRTEIVVSHRAASSSGAWTIERRSVGAGRSTHSFSLTRLDPATNYDVKVVATNALGDSTAPALSFVTAGGAPVVEAPEARDIGDTTVTLRAGVDTNEFGTRVTLQIDTDEAFTNYDEWFAGSIVAGSATTISLDVSELVDSTVYFARFVAVNKRGTTTSNVLTFTTTTPVGKLLKRRTDPVDPVPVVEPTPPAVDEPVVVMATPVSVRRPAAKAPTVGTKSTPKKKIVKTKKSSVKKRSVAR